MGNEEGESLNGMAQGATGLPLLRRWGPCAGLAGPDTSLRLEGLRRVETIRMHTSGASDTFEKHPYSAASQTYGAVVVFEGLGELVPRARRGFHGDGVRTESAEGGAAG